MIIKVVSLIFICLLLETASTVTSGQNHSFRNEMTGGLTKQGASSPNQLSEVSGHGITQSIIMNPTAEKTTKPTTEPLHTSPSKTPSTTPSQTSAPNIQTAPTLISSSLSQLNSSTEDMKPTTEVSTLTTMVIRSSRNPTTKHSILRSSTSSQDTGQTVTSQFSTDTLPYPSTGQTQPTDILTTTTFTKTDEHKSTSTSPATGLYMTNRPFIHSTKAKKRQDSPYINRKKHSKAVAGLIGGALVLMMVGFLLIYMKKRKLQRQQIKTTDWAGPSPFLESGADNGQVALRSSNRISFSSFLPLRLSKRLSLLPETDEELKEIRPGTTFGDEHGKGIYGQEEDGNDGQDNNRGAVVATESTGEAPETDINSVSLSSSQTTDPLCKNNNVEVINLSGAHPANPSTPSGAVENAQLNDSRGQP